MTLQEEESMSTGCELESRIHTGKNQVVLHSIEASLQKIRKELHSEAWVNNSQIRKIPLVCPASNSWHGSCLWEIRLRLGYQKLWSETHIPAENLSLLAPGPAAFPLSVAHTDGYPGFFFSLLEGLFLGDHICPGTTLSLIFALFTAQRPTKALETCHPHPLTLAQLFVANAFLFYSGPSGGNGFNRNNSKFSQALPSGRLEWSFQDIWFFWRKQIQLVIVFPFNMPEECSCTLARAFFFHSTNTYWSLSVHLALGWVGKGEVKRMEIWENDFDPI